MSNRKQCADEFLQLKRLEEGRGEGTFATCGWRVCDDQQGLQCDGCEGWFHGFCENVSSREYKYLLLAEEIMWFCKRCNNSYRVTREENKTERRE